MDPVFSAGCLLLSCKPFSSFVLGFLLDSVVATLDDIMLAVVLVVIVAGVVVGGLAKPKNPHISGVF